MIETLRERRGHVFLPEDFTYILIPDLYSTDGTALPEKTVWLKYFCGAATWYLAELEKNSLLAFGYANLGDPQTAEWGYFDLTELEALEVETRYNYTLVVERDCFWEPVRFADVLPR